MARKKDLCRDARGQFVRNLGWKPTAAGYTQQKFYLGREETPARLASLKLEQVWEAICQRWERQTPQVPRRKDDASVRLETGAPDGPAGAVHFSLGAIVSIGIGGVEFVREGRPVWDETSLAIADAIRQGRTVARIPAPQSLAPAAGWTDLSIGEWLDELRRDFAVIHIQLRDEGHNGEAEGQIRAAGVRHLDEGRRMLRQAGGGERLHSALDQYAQHITARCVGLDGNVTPNGNTQAAQVGFIKRNLPDYELVDVDSVRIDSCLDILRLRPVGKRGKRVSVKSAQNYVKQFKAFLRWLNKNPDFGWTRPADLEFTPLRIPQTPQETAAMARTGRVATYSVDELRTLWEYASPLQRVFFLLALNCGFGRAELASLEMDDVHLRQKHPHEQEIGYPSTDIDGWVFRIRPKSRVYGEWKLWPETVAAIDWWMRQLSQIEVDSGVTTLLVNRSGRRYDAPTKANHANLQIPNSWLQLTTRIRRDHPNFRRLSFSKLRKTGGNLIRAAGGGEAAGVFLCHGTPVKSDGLLDLYTNRPFARVFEAIERVGAQLRLILAAVEEPFPERRRKGGDNISLGTIKRIESMRRQGFKIAHIAEQLGVSTETVRRRSKLASTKVR